MDTPMLPDLLLPVSEAVPCGVDLREDTTPHSIYFRLRDARAGSCPRAWCRKRPPR